MVSWETQGRVTAWQNKHQIAYWKAKAVALQYENKILHDIIRKNEFAGQVQTQMNYHNTDPENLINNEGQVDYQQEGGYDDDQQYSYGEEEYVNPEVDEQCPRQEQYEQYSSYEYNEQYPYQEDDEQYSYQDDNQHPNDNYYNDQGSYQVDYEQSNHDNVDQEVDESEEAIIISDEYVNFLVINAKYQKQFELEREQRKKQEQQKEKDEEEQIVVKQSPDKRNSELQNLYGQDWKRIASTMMYVEAQYLNVMDLCKPAYWPVLPLNMNG